MTVDMKKPVIAGTVTAGSTPWLLIAQVILLVLNYGLKWSMPWWVVFLPALIWVALVLFVVFILLECVWFAIMVVLGDNGGTGGWIGGGIIAAVLSGVTIYGLWWAFTSLCTFFAGLV